MSKIGKYGLGAMLLAAAAPLSAQLIGGTGGLLGPVGGAVDRTLGAVTGPVTGPITGSPSASGADAPVVSLDHVAPSLGTAVSSASSLLELRRLRIDSFIRSNRDTLDRDPDGAPVRRSALVLIDPQAADLDQLASAGFRTVRDEQADGLGIHMVTMTPPKGMNVRDAAKRVAKIAPGVQFDFDHIYEPAGGALDPVAGKLAAAVPFRPGTRIAMIDGGMASHPSLSRASIEQRGFAGPAQPTGHGTAVGSLLVGSDGVFRGAAQGANLFVGDVYGGNAAAGSATVIVRALAWAVSKRPSVINISLVGPANAVLKRAIDAVRARGIAVVAAVGNDGPAAPPQYPAAYPGVIAVTAVDGGDRALREAGRAAHLDFAAPGADLAAALPGKGYTVVRGTSFASPLVAARLAAVGNVGALMGEAVPGKGKVGNGIICKSCRIAPRSVGIK